MRNPPAIMYGVGAREHYHSRDVSFANEKIIAFLPALLKRRVMVKRIPARRKRKVAMATGVARANEGTAPEEDEHEHKERVELADLRGLHLLGFLICPTL